MTITLRLSEVPLHLYQVTAGFHALHHAGAFGLRVEKLHPGDPQRLPYNMLEAILPDGRRLIYDMNDGYRNLLPQGEPAAALYDPLLSRCDLLFKRSFSAAENASLCAPEKIRRTPPNFLVTRRGNPAHRPVPCDPRREQIKKIIRLLPGSQYYNGHVLEQKLFDTPHVSPTPKILFMARLWDPDGDYPGQLTEDMRAERADVNRTRADCIRRLRKEFGDRFYGGVSPSPFAARDFSDVVLDTPALARKNAYLAFMKQFDIQIATMGLHGSTGWKFAEYLAASKAVVSETLRYESAGGLREGVHYLRFDDADGCVRQVAALLDERTRETMMQANHTYAEQRLRCDAFVRTTLEDAGFLEKRK